MKILFCSSEAAPFAKTGGLADVSGALPKALTGLGHEVKVFLPKYKMIDEKKFNLEKTSYSFDINLSNKKYTAALYKSYLPDLKTEVYFIDNPDFFNRDGLYQDKGTDFPDNLERFTFFSLAVLQAAKVISFKPQVINCNDWQTSLINVYLKTNFSDDPFFADTKTVLTIHNLGYQGVFPAGKFSLLNLPAELLSPEKLKCNGDINLLKAGIIFTDIISTVSPTYSEEIQTAEFGCGLEYILQKRKKDIIGILNGVDYSDWNPAADNNIVAKYDSKSINLKKKCKEDLQVKTGLLVKDAPLIGLVGRLADQKGLDLITSIIDDLMKLDLQIILLGTGEPKYHALFERIKQTYPGKISVNLGFDNKLAHQIEAGADMFLMPSKYEPCGLNQIYSLKYGTAPIVRKTGGLADTITDYNEKTDTGTGFVFEEYKPKVLFETILRAVNLYKDKTKWQNLMMREMGEDFSWEKSAKMYEDLYNKVLLAKV